MAILTPSLAVGAPIYADPAGTLRTHDDSSDRKSGGVYSHNPLECSATEVNEWASLLLFLCNAMKFGGGAVLVRNTTGSTLAAGTAVYVSGYDSGTGRVLVAKADSTDPLKFPCLFIESSLATASNGTARFGVVVGLLDTSAASAVGDKVYLDASPPGAWTLTAPSLPNRAIEIGRVSAKDAVNGSILFKVTPRGINVLGDLANIDLTGLSDGYTLKYVDSTKKWTPYLSTDTDERVKADSGGTPGYLDAVLSSTYFEAVSHVMAIKAASLTYDRVQNVSATDKLLGRASSGAGTIEEISCTSAGRALLDDADAAAQRTTLGVDPAISTEAKTQDYSVVSGDKHKVLTNEGSSGVRTFTLPSAAAGVGPFTFVMQTDAGGGSVKVQAATGDVIHNGSGTTTSGGYLTATVVGAVITLYAVNATDWFAVSTVGTWTPS